MGTGWREKDLQGGGLQTANLILAQKLKRARRAYGLLALAPLGLHRAYLDSPSGAWLWRGAGLAVAALLWWSPAVGLGGLAVLAAAAVADAIWIDRRVTALNKRIRREVYLSQDAAPPPGFRGRDPEGGSRIASFADQERLLRELEARKTRPRRDS